MLEALLDKYAADVSIHKANIRIYMNNSVGIGDHPDILEALSQEVKNLCTAIELHNTVENLIEEYE